MTDTQTDKTYSTRQFAQKFGFYTGDVQKACKSGEVQATKNEKGFWRIPESEVVKFRKEFSIKK